MEEELARASRYRRPLSLILVDLDHFKRCNDTHGHNAGDAILRHVAQLLAANVRAVDLAGRYGGEEFLIVLPETDPDAAAALAEKLRRIVGGSQLRLPSGEVVIVTMCAGVAGGLGDVLRLDALVRDADAALYSAKALGRNQVYVFRETGDEGTSGARRSPPRRATRAIDVGKAAMVAAAGRAHRHARRAPGVGGQAVDHDRRGVRRARAARSTCRRASSSASARRASCTTSASSRSRRRSCQAGRPRRRRSGGSSPSTRRSARSSWSRRARCATRRRSSSTTTSGTTAGATRMASPAARSRSARGSCRSSTPTRR